MKIEEVPLTPEEAARVERITALATRLSEALVGTSVPDAFEAALFLVTTAAIQMGMTDEQMMHACADGWERAKLVREQKRTRS